MLEAMPFPALVVRMVDELLDTQVQVRQAGRAQLAIDNGPRCCQPTLAPLRTMGIGRIIDLRIIPDTGADQIDTTFSHPLVLRHFTNKKLHEVVPDGGDLL